MSDSVANPVRRGFAGLDALRADVSSDIANARKMAATAPPRPSPPAATPPTAPPSKPIVPHPPSAAVGNSGAGWWLLGAVGLVVWVLYSAQSGKPSQRSNPQPAPVAAPARFEEQKPPVGRNHVLAGAQINYCIAEDFRVEGMRAAAEVLNEVDAFNAVVDDYNSRCGEYQYYGGAVDQAKRVVAPYETALKQEGYERLIPSVDPQSPGGALSPAPGSMVAHVVVESANIRNGPSQNSAIVGKLDALSSVHVTSTTGDWYSIRFGAGMASTGWIARRLVVVAGYESAKAQYCEPERPRTGTVLSQTQSGPHSIRIVAGSNDVVTKLKGANSGTALAFYVRANESFTLDSVPEGSFRVLFASGGRYSRKCGEFLDDMSVQEDPNEATFETTTDDGNVYTSIAEYRLVEQANGNFRPRSTDASAFRD